MKTKAHREEIRLFFEGRYRILSFLMTLIILMTQEIRLVTESEQNGEREGR